MLSAFRRAELAFEEVGHEDGEAGVLREPVGNDLAVRDSESKQVGAPAEGAESACLLRRPSPSQLKGNKHAQDDRLLGRLSGRKVVGEAS